MAFGFQIAIANILEDLNLMVRNGIAIRIYASKKFWRIYNLAVAHDQAVCQTAKFNSLPNFPVIQYVFTSNSVEEDGGHQKLPWFTVELLLDQAMR